MEAKQGWWQTPLTLILRRKRQGVFNFKATLTIQQGVFFFFSQNTKPGDRAHSESNGGGLHSVSSVALENPD